MEYLLKGSNGELIKRKIIFGPPHQDAVVKIANTKEDLVVECAEVVEGGDFVLVKGHFNKSIEYLTAKRELLHKLIGKEDKKNDKEDAEKDGEEKEKKSKKEVVCEPMCPEPQCMAVDGVIRHTTVWIPFEILVNVEGTKVGDKVTVETIKIESIYKGSRIHEIREDELIVGIAINDIINVSVVVEKYNPPCVK